MKIQDKLSNFKRILFCFVITLMCTACFQDVIDVDDEQIEKQIVIEGVITDQPSTCEVSISETANIYQNENPLRISNARVTISDGEGNISSLSETSPGIYRNNLLTGVPGRLYTMEVNVDSKIYTAVSKMPVPLEIDSVVYNSMYHPVPISFYFTDHEGIEDYCRFKIYRNFHYLENEKILYHDKYTDGETILVDNIDELFYENERLEIKAITIDKNIYDFYSVLYNYEDEDSEDITLLDLASANPKSNISNDALGYFSAQTVRSFVLIIN